MELVITTEFLSVSQGIMVTYAAIQQRLGAHWGVKSLSLP